MPTAFDQMVLVCILLVYLLPSVIALGRGVAHWYVLFLINLVLGWTCFTWAILLYLAMRADPEADLPAKRPSPRTEPRLS